MLHNTIVRSNTLKYSATRCNTLQLAATRYKSLQRTLLVHVVLSFAFALAHLFATHCTFVCNTLHIFLQHTAPHCTTLHNTVMRCNTLQHTVTFCNTLQRTLLLLFALSLAFALFLGVFGGVEQHACHVHPVCTL